MKKPRLIFVMRGFFSRHPLTSNVASATPYLLFLNVKINPV
jgi:hypothetical protein